MRTKFLVRAIIGLFLLCEGARTFEQAEYGCIGIIIDTHKDHLRILDLVVGSPAWLSELQRNDVIMSIDGVSTYQMDLDKAVSLLRGNIGTSVILSIQRKGLVEELQFEIKREKIFEKQP